MHRRKSIGSTFSVAAEGIAVTLSNANDGHPDFRGRPHFYIEGNDAHSGVGFMQLSLLGALELALGILARLEPRDLPNVQGGRVLVEPQARAYLARACFAAYDREMRIQDEGDVISRTIHSEDETAARGLGLAGELVSWSWDAGQPFAMQTFGNEDTALTELVLVVSHPAFALKAREALEPVLKQWKRAKKKAQKEEAEDAP